MDVARKRVGIWLFWGMAIVSLVAIVAEAAYMANKNGHGIGVGDGQVVREQPESGGDE